MPVRSLTYEVVEGAIPVGGRSGGEHARAVLGAWCAGEHRAVRRGREVQSAGPAPP